MIEDAKLESVFLFVESCISGFQFLLVRLLAL